MFDTTCSLHVTYFDSSKTQNQVNYNISYITNLTYNKLIMRACKVCSFISSYILHINIMCWKHIWHTDKCVDEWSTTLWMNKCHMNFACSYKSMFQTCFQYTISMCKTHELWMNKFCTISIKLNHEMLSLWCNYNIVTLWLMNKILGVIT